MPEIDSLNIKIKASGSDASRSINTLVQNLGKLNAALNNYSDNSPYIKGIQNLASGFESIANSVNKIDTGKIGTLAKNLSSITRQLGKLDQAASTIGFGDLTRSANVMGEAARKVGSQLAETWGIKDKRAVEDLQTKFDAYLDSAVSGSNKVNQNFNDLADTIRDNARIADASKAVYADLLKYVEKTNSAFLKGSGSSITLGFSPSEFVDDYTSMRATLGAAFTSQPGAGNGDFENYVTELNGVLGNIIPIGNTAAETFQNFVRVLRDARNSTMSFSEAVSNGFVGIDSVDENIIELSDDLYKLEKAARQAGGTAGTTSDSFAKIAESLNGLSAIDIPDTTNLSNMVNAISGLGSAKIEKASKNMPALADGLKKLFASIKTIPPVNQSVIQMTNALGNLANQGSRVGTASRSLTNGLNNSSSAMNRARKSSLSLAAAFGKFYATWFLAIRSVKKLWGSIKDSMDYIETLNYFNAGFEQIASKADLSSFEELGYRSAEEYAKSFSEKAKELTAKMSGFSIMDNGMLNPTGQPSLGINPDTLLNYQAMFGQMASSMGVASKNATILSNVLTEIGADLASVKNMDFADVWQDMASGLTGMSRTLDKYGVNIRNVNLQQKLYDLGIDVNIANLNQQDKALLRTIVLLDSTRYAWGDLADTIQQPSNQLRLLQANFQNLSRTIGGLFLPIVQKVLPYINALVIAVQRLAQWLANLIGIDLGSISSAVGGIDMSGFTDGMDDAADSMGNAAKEAEKLKKGIREFDELKVITTKDDTDSGKDTGVGAGGLLDSAFLDAVSEYQKAWDDAFAKLQNKAEELADKLEKVFEPIKKLFQDIFAGDWFAVGEDVSSIAASIFNFFADAIASVDWYAIGNAIGLFLAGINWTEILMAVGRFIWEALKAVLALWAGSFDAAPIETGILTAVALLKFTKIGQLLGTKLWAAFIKGIKTIAKNIAASLAATLGVSIGELIAGIALSVGGLVLAVTNFFSMLRSGFDWIKEIFMVIGIALVAIGAVILGAPAAIAAVVAGIVAALATLVVVIHDNWDAIVEWTSAMWEKIKEVFGAVAEWVKTNVIEPVVGFVSGLVDRVSAFFEGLWIIIKAIWIVAATWFNATVIQPLLNFFKPVIDKISQLFLTAWNTIKAAWSVAANWFNSTIIIPIQKGFKVMSSTVEGIFKNLWSVVKRTAAVAINSVIAIAEGMINKIIDGLNFFIAGFNVLAKTAAAITKDSYGGIEPFNHVSLTKVNIDSYEQGGFPQSYSMFMAGENGIPEMLGTVGGRTAVAGGAEITGISDAIYSTSQREIELLRQQNSYLSQLLEKEFGISKNDIGRAAQDFARDYKRRTNRDAYA